MKCEFEKSTFPKTPPTILSWAVAQPLKAFDAYELLKDKTLAQNFIVPFIDEPDRSQSKMDGLCMIGNINLRLDTGWPRILIHKRMLSAVRV